MTRARNPRRLVLEHLHTLKDLLEQQVGTWTVRRTVYVPQDERSDPSVFLRPRLPGEYPETQGGAWLALAYEMDRAAKYAQGIAAYARQQALTALHAAAAADPDGGGS